MISRKICSINRIYQGNYQRLGCTIKDLIREEEMEKTKVRKEIK